MARNWKQETGNKKQEGESPLAPIFMPVYQPIVSEFLPSKPNRHAADKMLRDRVWTKSCPDARRRRICNRSILKYVRIVNSSATRQMGDFSFKHY
jgi:hypothetical protein